MRRGTGTREPRNDIDAKVLTCIFFVAVEDERRLLFFWSPRCVIPREDTPSARFAFNCRSRGIEIEIQRFHGRSRRFYSTFYRFIL